MIKRDHVIRLVALQGVNVRTEHDGRFLRSFDPSKNYDPAFRLAMGEIKSTDDPLKALAFYGPEDAKKFWGQQHGYRPVDGRPHRPLTAYIIQIERIGTVA